MQISFYSKYNTSIPSFSRKLPKIPEQELRQLAETKSVKEIAEFYNRSVINIYNHFMEYRIQTNLDKMYKERRLILEQHKPLFTDNKLSAAKVSEITGVPKSYVYSWRKDNGYSKNTFLDTETKEAIIKKLSENIDKKVISEEFNIPISTIYKYMKFTNRKETINNFRETKIKEMKAKKNPSQIDCKRIECKSVIC